MRRKTIKEKIMTCPKCNKDACVLVTTEMRTRTTTRRGIVLWVLLFPFMFLHWLYRLAFGRRQKFYKKQHWHCNYCNHDWPQAQ
jgi:transcription elongation factor Elf1